MKNLINYLSKKSLSLGNGPALDRRWTGHESGRSLSILTLFLMLFSFGVGNAWAGTSTLTSAIISSGTTGNSYASYSFNADGKTWNAYAIHNYHSKQTNTVYYLQIKAYASSTAYYVQIPTMPGKINSISMIVSSTGQPKTGGSNTATFYFSASNRSTTAASGLSANPVTAVSASGGSSVTLDCSPLNLTGGYITASGGTRIWEIEVTYCVSPTSPTNGTITSSTAHLSWSDASNTGSYEVYRSTSNTAPVYNTTPTTTVSNKYVDFESLTASTTYYWWVRSNCGTGNKSAWVAGSSFATSAGACTAPSSVSITGTTKYLGGQTISLTATPSGGSGTTTYQWQKKISGVWTNLSNGTISGVTTSGATGNNLQISPCTHDNSGGYRCVVSTGATCSTNSHADNTDGYGVHVFSVYGGYVGESWSDEEIAFSAGTSGTATVHLNAGSLYKFHIRSNNGAYYCNGTADYNGDGSGDGGTTDGWYVLKSTTSSISFGRSDKNYRIYTGPEGDYTISVNIANALTGDDYVTVDITYPTPTHPCAGFAYFEKPSEWTNVYLYWYTNDNSRLSGWTTTPEITTTATICGTTYYYTPLGSSFSNVIFKGNGTNEWTSLATSGFSGKYLDKTTYASPAWASFPTYTISFDKGTGTGGTMSSITDITGGANQLLPANSFTKTGYDFDGWIADVDVKISGSTVTEGTKFSGGVTLQEICGDVALTAQWVANSYDVTLKKNGGAAAADQVVSATYDSDMPLVVKTAGTDIVVPSRNGYTFQGYWDTSESSGGTQYYSYSGTPAVLASVRAWDKTSATNLYGRWQANVYTVTLDNQSATTAGAASVSATFGQAMPSIASNLPAKTGYRFDGYYTDKNGGGTKYYNADGSSATNMAMYSANPKLYANWVAQLTFSVNGAIDGTLTRDVTADLPSSADVPTACGDCWAFAGWDASSTCSTTPGHAGEEDAATHGITTPTTLYAVFSKAEYKLIKSTSDLVANDNYVLTIVNSGSEYAMSNEAQASYEYEIARTDVTSSLRENADGYFLYNVSANNIWKFTGTSSSGQLYNAAADKYLNLSSTAGSSTSMLNTTDNLTFSVDDIYWTIHGTKYLHPYGVYGGGWEATSSGSWDADEDFSCYLYHQISAEYATEPSCETYDIVWKVDNTPLASGSQTEETNTCAGIEELPEDPDDDVLDCATKFVGWSEQELVGVGHDAPADLFTSVGDAPAIDEDKTFHAVFATTIGTPIAAIEDTEFSSSDESGSYCKATFSFKAADEYLQKQSIWTSSNMTNVKVRIRVYHVSNNTSDVLRVSLINSSGVEVVGADLTTNNTGSDITSAGGYSSYVELTPTTAVTGYKVSMKTKNSFGTGINKIEREVVASSFKDYVTMCCDYIVTLSDGSPSNGSVTFDPAGPIETCTAAKEVSMTITPDPGYYLSAWTSSGVTPTSVDPAITTNNANAQTTTVTFAKETTEGTYTAGATFSAKALEGWTWMYKKDADAADDAVDPYAIPDVVELYKDQYARFIITGYTPTDVIADKQGYVYSAGGVEPAYSTDYLTYVSKNGSAPYSYYQLKGKAPTESTTITFKAVGDASITKTVTIRVKALPTVTFVDLIHNKTDFTNSGDGWTAGTGVLTSTVSTGAVSHAKKTPTHTDVSAPVSGNTCEQGHLHLIGWIRSDYSKVENYLNGIGNVPTMSELTSAGTGYWFDPNADINVETYNGKTFYAVWAKVE